ncbi:S46 family peptidase [candidate division KSB1 bacterium]
MKKTIVVISVVFIVLLGFGFLTADEGMYTPDKIKDLDLGSKGMKISHDKVFNPGKDAMQEAIILLGGGTSEFVSPNGLILTNHHVAYGAVAEIATEEANYLEDGFMTRDMNDEIPVQNLDAKILRHYEDVTEEVLKEIDETVPEEERDAMIERNTEIILEKARNKDSSLEFSVEPFYDGNRFYLQGYFAIQDIRVVFVPPGDIGVYGGDTDNWMWPRHTGDFAFLRAYVSRDGRGEAYSEDNVPYEPRSWLRTHTEGVVEGDFVFMMGYPGTTYRFRDSYYIEDEYSSYLPFVIGLLNARLKVLESAAEKDVGLKLEYAEMIQGYNNTLKNYVGKIEGIEKQRLIEQRRLSEERFTGWLREDETLWEKYGSVLPGLRRVYARKKQTADREHAIIAFQQSGLVRTALQLMNSGGRAAQSDEFRNQINKSIEELFLPLETANFRFALRLAERLEGDGQFQVVEELLGNAEGNERTIRAVSLASEAYDFSRELGILNEERREELFSMTRQELLDSGDLFFQIAEMMIYEIPRYLAGQDETEQELKRLNRMLTDVYMQYWMDIGKDLYPDANRTLRFNYGYVKGYSPRDAVYYRPFTLLRGVFEKETGEDPFEVPERLRDIFTRKDFNGWYSSELGGMPVNFLSTNDSTGGNSGSPMLNANGELVGILFDGNYEAMTSDYEFSPEITRTISVDIRYVLLITEKWGAGYILDEMKI